MNQIPNIEETHNTRESAKKVLKEYYGYKSEQDVPYGLAAVLEDWLHHQLQKARESNEWKDPKTEVPDFEVDVLCDLLNHTTGNHHYAILKRMDEEDAEWFTSDDESELNAWNYVVVGWKYINHPYHSELDQDVSK